MRFGDIGIPEFLMLTIVCSPLLVMLAVIWILRRGERNRSTQNTLAKYPLWRSILWVLVYVITSWIAYGTIYGLSLIFLPSHASSVIGQLVGIGVLAGGMIDARLHKKNTVQVTLTVFASLAFLFFIV